jgi:quercetin dioxygenase-like cupin family protein
VISRILAGQGQGCTDITVRLLTIQPSGKLPRIEYEFQRIVTVLQGSLLFVDGDGAAHSVAEGDVIIVRPYESHHFRNDSSSLSRIIISETRGRT